MELKRLKYKSLKFKIGLVIVLFLSCTLLLKTYINIHISRKQMEGDLRNRVIEASKKVAEDFEQSDHIEPSVALDLSVSRLRREYDLVKLEAYSLSGTRRELVALAERSDLQINPEYYDLALSSRAPKVFSMAQDNDRYLVVINPIEANGRVIGLVSALASLSDVDDWAKKQFNLFLITSSVSVVLLSLLLSIYLNRLITNPLNEIVRAMEKVKAGDLMIKAKITSQDEIGELAKYFNSMVAKIKEEDERIENFNKELQVKIEEATKKLHERNQELMQLTEDLFEMQNEMSRMETLASLGQLAASVAHEIGTPLHSISGHVQLLFEKGNLPAEALERLNIIQAQIERLTGIINRILSTTRLPEPAFQRVDVNSVIKDIINLTQPGLRKKNIDIHTQLSDRIPPIFADQNQLQQVFLNLITNAVDAMPNGGTLNISTGFQNNGNLRSQGRVSHNQEANGFVAIEFQDSGVGILSEDIKSIFKPFFSTKRQKKAAGLGLPICKKIIKDHRGDIDVVSTVNQGTTFIVKLPPADPTH